MSYFPDPDQLAAEAAKQNRANEEDFKQFTAMAKEFYEKAISLGARTRVISNGPVVVYSQANVSIEVYSSGHVAYLISHWESPTTVIDYCPSMTSPYSWAQAKKVIPRLLNEYLLKLAGKKT